MPLWSGEGTTMTTRKKGSQNGQKPEPDQLEVIDITLRFTFKLKPLLAKELAQVSGGGKVPIDTARSVRIARWIVNQDEKGILGRTEHAR
jgi:hypothetical protein